MNEVISVGFGMVCFTVAFAYLKVREIIIKKHEERKIRVFVKVSEENKGF